MHIDSDSHDVVPPLTGFSDLVIYTAAKDEPWGLVPEDEIGCGQPRP